MPANFLTGTDVENYGPELVDFAQRAAAHALGPHLQDLQAQNAALRNRLDQESKRNLNQQLDAQLPNWREIDASPGWRQWLSMPDPLSGIQRQRLLNDAIQQGTVHRVIGFFRGFQAEQAAGHYADDSSYAQAHRARARQAASGQRTFSRAEIAKIYEQRRKGLYDDQQFARLEAEIFRASAEGRIAGGLDLYGR
jgi:hypothetical protein